MPKLCQMEASGGQDQASVPDGVIRGPEARRMATGEWARSSREESVHKGRHCGDGSVLPSRIVDIMSS